MKNTFKWFCFILGIITIINCHNSETKQPLKHPNVLFIMIDDLNDYQGFFGGHPQARTPNIDKLAESGTAFTNAHTNVPVCSPSRNSLMTGIYPHNSRDYGWTPHFKQTVLKNHKTFIELFKENGYNTYGTGKLLHKNVKSYWTKWGVPEGINYGPHASSGINENGMRIMGHSSVPDPFKSINVVDGSFAPLSDTPIIKNKNGDIQKTGWTYGNKAYNYTNDSIRDLMPDEQHAQWVTKTIKSLELKGDSIPFFLGVGFVKPHTPLYAPQKYFDMFPLDSIKMPIIKDGDIDDLFYTTVYEPTEMGLAYFRKLKQSYPDGDLGLRKFLQAYLACVAFVDDQVGKVVDALDQSKFKDNTIVVLVSDHGWQMGQKEYLYKNSPWDESTRIPYIIRDPQRSKPGSKVNHAVSLIDIFPTFKNLCHLSGSITKDESAAQLDGFSLKPFLENSNTKSWKGPDGALSVLGAGINKPIEGIGFNSNPGALWHIEITAPIDSTYTTRQNFTYRTKDWRYILYRNGKEELYNHIKDPYEWYNLAKNPEYNKVKNGLKTDMLKIINLEPFQD